MKKPTRPRDANQLAKFIVDMSTGQTTEPDPMEGKNPARIADVSRTAVDKLLVDAGKACLDYQDKVFRNLPCRNIQCDEIWSFVYAKDKNSPFAQIDQRFDKFTPPSI